MSSSFALRALDRSTAELNLHAERLSSGMRINRASDDAAGLAVSSSLRADARVFNAALKNVNDVISFLSIMDGASAELSSVVIRLRELSEQSANGAYSSAQRSAIDSEFQSLVQEHNRILDTVSFNDILAFNSDSAFQLTAQVGYSSLSMTIGSTGTEIAGDGTFQTGSNFTVGATPDWITSADLNGDGRADLITADRGPDTLSVLIGNGDGTFLAATTLGTTANPNSVIAIDINSDNRIDLVSADNTAGVISVFIGNGNGTFNARQSFTAAGGSNALSFADFNRDGGIDIVVAAESANAVSILLGNNDGSFKARSNVTTDTGPEGVTTGDFNGDGWADIAIAATNANKLDVFLNDGSGSFSTRVSYAIGASPNAVVTADIDEDGILDLIASGENDDVLGILFGNSNGTFQAQITVAIGDAPRTVRVSDLNEDGSLDLISTLTGVGAGVSVVLGNGNGTFNARRTYTVGTGPQEVVVADINGDSALDLVSANTGTNTVSTLLGNVTSVSVARSIERLSGLSVATREGALIALDSLAEHLSDTQLVRGSIGAWQSRFEVSIRTLRSASENYTHAASRIIDADVAETTAAYVRSRILQDVGVFVLRQANQNSRLALDLLRG